MRKTRIKFGRSGWRPHVMFEGPGYDGAVGFWKHPDGKPWAFVHRDYYDGEIVALWVGSFSVCLRR